MKLFGILSIAGLALFNISCGGSSNVYVVDPSGNPVADATIVPSTTSYNKPPVQTDSQGGAMIHQDFPYLEWLNVSKRGYESAHVSYAQPKPMTITLKPN